MIYKPEFLDEANRVLQAEVDTLKEMTKLTEMQRIQSLCTTYARCLLIACGLQAF